MKNFKPGQKVRFSTKDVPYFHPGCTKPKEGEIVTIKRRCIVHPNHWDIEEYQFAKDGVRQSFFEGCLFPIEETGITLTMTRAELREMKPKEVLEKTINNHLMQEQ